MAGSKTRLGAASFAVTIATEKISKQPTRRDRPAPGKKRRQKAPPFFVAGVGASAGGLEALTLLLRALQGEVPLTLVIIQHMSHTQPSLLVQLLARETPLPVQEVKDGSVPKPGVIFIAPPKRNIEIKDGRFVLSEPHSGRVPTPSVDHFFNALAREFGHQAIGIVLSGTGHDGAAGLAAIKRADGRAYVQQPDTARYDGMPASAIAQGAVDAVLPPDGIARLLLELARGRTDTRMSELSRESQNPLDVLLLRLKSRTGMDIRGYKQTTMRRRLARRLNATRCATVEHYLDLVTQQPEELDLLLQEMFISVTAFFRDRTAFDRLALVVREMIREGKPADELRVWVVGCATGEEAYSMTMVLLEALREANDGRQVRVFATDVSQDALSHARRGLYAQSIATHVPADLLERYFDRVDSGYQVRGTLRTCISFSRHDVIGDPPFMRADIVSCRNLLIYFQPELQARVIPRLHYALKQSGLLFVGKSESVAQFEGYFEQIGKGGHLFRARGLRQLPPLTSAMTPRVSPGQLQLTAVERMHAEHTRLLMDAYAPPSMLVTRDGSVVHTIGDVSAFVSFPAGRPTLNVAQIMRGEYRGEVQMLLHRASRENALVTGRSHPQSSGAGVMLTVRPATAIQPNTYLLAFERVGGEAKPSFGPDAAAGEVVLRSELTATQENLQTVVEELETQNEEMQALNEELQSTNEEMQSANEELETANEELQSSNEELTTVNDELSRKSRDLEDANADMLALLESLPYPVLHLDELLSITRTNSAARRLFGLPSVYPVSLDHIALPGEFGQLREVLGRVRTSGEAYESQLQLGSRNFHLVVTQSRLPSRQAFGVLVQLVDVTSLAVANRELLNSQKRVIDILRSSSLLVVICDPRGQVEFINPRCAETLAIDAQDANGREFWRLFEASQIAGMRKQFLAALSAESVTELALSVQVGPHEKRLHTVWIPLAGTDGERTGLCWKALDITELEQSRLKTLQSDAMNRAVLNAIPAVVSVLDATGKIVAVNEGWRDFARNNGVPGKDWIGENYLDCLGGTVHLEPDSQKMREGILDVLAGRRPVYTADYPCHGPDTQRWFQVHVVQMGEPVGGVAIMHFDITRIRLAHDHLADLKEVLEATVTTRTRDLQQAVDELEMFSFTVSHDLRTPLRGMIGFGEVLQTEHWASLNADARGCVQRIVAGAQRMSQYLEELLKLSHLSRGELLSEDIDVTKLVHEIAEEFAKREPARRVEFSAAGELKLRGDPSLMRAVFENLIGNAWKFTRPRDPARIVVGTAMYLGKPTVFVRDNGVGFDMSYKNQLFMPFQRLHPTGAYEGSGLGLAAARRIVMRHGGTLDAEARLDLGATFYVWLPEGQ